MTGSAACALCLVFRRPVKDRRDAQVGCACHACLDIVEGDLFTLASLSGALPRMLAPRGSGGDHSGGGHRAPGPRLPLSLDALSLMGPGSTIGVASGAVPPAALLRDWAGRWAVARSLGLTGPVEYTRLPDGRIYVPRATTVWQAATWLTRRLPWAAERTSTLPTFASQVAHTLAGVRRVTEDTLPAADTSRRIGWCPAPGPEGEPCMASLSASTWDDLIKCHECGAEYHRAHGGWDILARSMRITHTGLKSGKGTK